MLSPYSCAVFEWIADYCIIRPLRHSVTVRLRWHHIWRRCIMSPRENNNMTSLDNGSLKMRTETLEERYNLNDASGSRKRMLVWDAGELKLLPHWSPQDNWRFCRCRRLKTKNKVSEISATQQLNMSMEISGEEPTPGNNNIIVRPYTRTLLWRVITTVYERMAPLLDVDQHNFDLGTGQRTWNTDLQFASFSMKSCFCGNLFCWNLPRSI